jgi:glycolate oxidase iron-sulfur subunit
VHSSIPDTLFSRPAPATTVRAGILLEADSCVKCGLCLPHCPTYRLSADEAESPRGRIALIQGWLNGAVAGDERLHGHLDRCLQCGACETACPSLVPFTALMDRAREERNAAFSPVKRRWRRWVADRLAHPRALHRLLRLYRVSGLKRVAHASGLLKPFGLAKLERLGDELGGEPVESPARQTRDGGNALLYTGCVGRYLDTNAHGAAVRVLQHLGYGVEVPGNEHCCGALHRHDGLPDAAARELAASRRLFARANQTPVLAMASACAAELRRDPDLAPVVRDICRFLADLPWPEDRRPRPFPGRVWVHTPCSQANLLADPRAAMDLLRLIPGIRLSELPHNPTCCGAAGAYLLRQPAMARALLQDKLTAIHKEQAEIVVTTNTGCAAHLRGGIAQAGLQVEVCHPVELLARQLTT